MKPERTLVIIFAFMAFAITVSWVVLLFTREEVPAGITGLMSGMVTACVTLSLKARHPEDG